MADDRLNFGCGPVPAPGWVNSDRHDHGQDHVGDIRDGLPFNHETFDYIVSHHALQMLAWDELVPALAELRRVTAPGGWVRLSVPDLIGAIHAYDLGLGSHFQIADAHEATLDGKLCLYLTQGGSTRSLFTSPWLADLCRRAGWHDPRPGRFGVTASPWPDIASLDSRPSESIFIEAHA